MTTTKPVLNIRQSWSLGLRFGFLIELVHGAGENCLRGLPIDPSEEDITPEHLRELDRELTSSEAQYLLKRLNWSFTDGPDWSENALDRFRRSLSRSRKAAHDKLGKSDQSPIPPTEMLAAWMASGERLARDIFLANCSEGLKRRNELFPLVGISESHLAQLLMTLGMTLDGNDMRILSGLLKDNKSLNLPLDDWYGLIRTVFDRLATPIPVWTSTDERRVLTLPYGTAFEYRTDADRIKALFGLFQNNGWRSVETQRTAILPGDQGKSPHLVKNRLGVSISEANLKLRKRNPDGATSEDSRTILQFKLIKNRVSWFWEQPNGNSHNS